MKKLYYTLKLLLSIVLVICSGYGLIAVTREPKLEGGARLAVLLVSLVMFLASIFSIINFIRLSRQKEKEPDEIEKDRIREEVYREWQKSLAESEAEHRTVHEKKGHV